MPRSTEACETAWAFFGGIFKSVVVDNTKAIVHTADPLHPRLVDGFVEYSQMRGFVIDTEEQLDQALFVAERHTDEFCLLDVHLDPLDRSPALQRLAERLAKKL